MTRIVAGAAKGRRLAVPPEGTRPTSDRAREALFNTLAGLVDLDGARVLDLYAGSGAVGLEALSRGASEAAFVENDRSAAAVITANAGTLALAGARVIRAEVAAHVRGPGPGDPFDLIFADPPYALPDEDLAAVLLAVCRPGWLHPDGVLVVERSARGGEPPWPDVIEPLKQKRYGEGALWYGRPR